MILLITKFIKHNTERIITSLLCQTKVLVVVFCIVEFTLMGGLGGFCLEHSVRFVGPSQPSEKGGLELAHYNL